MTDNKAETLTVGISGILEYSPASLNLRERVRLSARMLLGRTIRLRFDEIKTCKEKP